MVKIYSMMVFGLAAAEHISISQQKIEFADLDPVENRKLLTSHGLQVFFTSFRFILFMIINFKMSSCFTNLKYILFLKNENIICCNLQNSVHTICRMARGRSMMRRFFRCNMQMLPIVFSGNGLVLVWPQLLFIGTLPPQKRCAKDSMTRYRRTAYR